MFSYSPDRVMLRRPKPSDSEADLLLDQERFLASGARSTVKVIRRPDKRRGGGAAAGVDEGNGERQRDVVTIAGEWLVSISHLNRVQSHETK